MKLKILIWVLNCLVGFIRKRGFDVYIKFDVIGWFSYHESIFDFTFGYQTVEGVRIEKIHS